MKLERQKSVDTGPLEWEQCPLQSRFSHLSKHSSSTRLFAEGNSSPKLTSAWRALKIMALVVFQAAFCCLKQSPNPNTGALFVAGS